MGEIYISVVIAVYNMADTVERAILSVLSQTYQNSELIVMDGGSTDGTVDIIKKYSQRIAYWISASDKGPSDAIAKALPHAKGDFIGFLGADDWYEPNALLLVAETSANAEADLYFGNMNVHDGDQVYFKDLSMFKSENLYLNGTQWIGAVNSFVKKELLEENYRKENNFLLTDYMFFLRLFAEGKRFVHLCSDKAITNFSIGGRTTSLIYKTIKDARKVRQQFMEEYPEFQSIYDIYDERIKKIYALELSGYYMEAMNEREYQANTSAFFDADVPYILFGAGQYGRVCARSLRICGKAVDKFVDNDTKKWGIYLEGLRIDAAETLRMIEGRCIVVTTNPDYEEQIIKQLYEMGVDSKNHIISYSDIAVHIYEKLGVQVLDTAYQEGKIV